MSTWSWARSVWNRCSNAGNSHVTVKPIRGPKHDFGLNLSSEQHADSFRRYGFLLVFYSDLKSRWNRCWVTQAYTRPHRAHYVRTLSCTKSEVRNYRISSKDDWATPPGNMHENGWWSLAVYGNGQTDYSLQYFAPYRGRTKRWRGVETTRRQGHTWPNNLGM